MASNCIDFSAKEYSEQDGDGAENTDWKRTCRMPTKGPPCLQELYCDMSADVSLMSRSFAVDEAFPPVPFEEARSNATARAYLAYLRGHNHLDCPVVSFLVWLRCVASVDETGFVHRRAPGRTLTAGRRHSRVGPIGLGCFRISWTADAWWEL